ncbi:monosaccharide ABC transporter substrate-binding protein (CUT2 family) [Homoserinimonas aerilata]|uniref:Monosaccharide ABC transporter substrate-binding protein (CUT2 family) n=1 Tax=Homoserinimonas aerilata TaxID=1162970 RepID=A0A542YL12_9MICO|nr:substrate-binding domain-containing protein [Homoserinimonas aerilata]TQL48773.1 monosaccharide ABC transporter substrate-binding protein (CUT2 family) [Homoserinimonas aerilata]
MKSSRSRAVFGLIAAPLLIASLAACSSEDAPAAEGPAAAVDTAALQTMMDEFQQPLDEQVPESSPAIAQGKSIVVIPCTYASEACARGADSAMEAAEFLGWESRMIDPGGNPEKSRQAIDQAIQLGADGIIFTAAVGDQLSDKLVEAREAGLFLVNSMSPGDERFDADITPDEDVSGKMSAAAIALDSGGDAKILVTTDPAFPSIASRTVAFEKWLPELCPGCEIVETLETQMSQLQSGLPPQIQATLTAKPQIDYIWTHTGAAVVGSQATVERSASGDTIRMLSFDGNSANLELIMNGKNQFMDVIKPMEWGGYLMVHQMNRLFQGDLTSYELSNMPKRLVTADSMPELPWTGDSNWKSGFEKLWTAAG